MLAALFCQPRSRELGESDYFVNTVLNAVVAYTSMNLPAYLTHSTPQQYTIERTMGCVSGRTISPEKLRSRRKSQQALMAQSSPLASQAKPAPATRGTGQGSKIPRPSLLQHLGLMYGKFSFGREV